MSPPADASAPAAEELVEEVDTDGVVLGIVTRAEVRRHRVRHRCTFVAVLDEAGERVVVHRRADWKDVWPGRWDVAFGGVCGVGEDWASAAARELAEEAGLTATLVPVADGVAYEDDEVAEVAAVYTACTDAEPTCPDGEVAEVRWVALSGLPAWLAAHDVVPDSAALVVPHLLSSGP